jgi:hypothetical protein
MFKKNLKSNKYKEIILKLLIKHDINKIRKYNNGKNKNSKS